MSKNKPKVTARWVYVVSEYHLMLLVNGVPHAEVWHNKPRVWRVGAVVGLYSVTGRAITIENAKRRCEKWLTKQFAKMGIELEVVK